MDSSLADTGLFVDKTGLCPLYTWITDVVVVLFRPRPVKSPFAVHGIKQRSGATQHLGNGVSYLFSCRLSKTGRWYRAGGEHMITATDYIFLTQKETKSTVTKARVEAPHLKPGCKPENTVTEATWRLFVLSLGASLYVKEQPLCYITRLSDQVDGLSHKHKNTTQYTFLWQQCSGLVFVHQAAYAEPLITFLVMKIHLQCASCFVLPPDLFCQKFWIPKSTQIAFMQRNLKTKYLFTVHIPFKNFKLQVLDLESIS